MVKIYKATFNTAALTEETLLADGGYQFVEAETIKLIVTALNDVHGIEIGVGEWEYSPEGFSICGYNNDVESELRELIWAFEQAGGIYEGDRERFFADWAEGKYEPEGSLHLNKEWFSNLQLLREID